MARELILLVEDDSTTRQLYSQFLLTKSYRLVTAVNGVEALQMVNRMKPDLILLDIMMPELDGIGACLKIREAIGDTTPIVFVTAQNNAGMIRKALEAGGNDVIIKCADLAAVHERVKFWTKPHDPAEVQKRRQLALSALPSDAAPAR